MRREKVRERERMREKVCMNTAAQYALRCLPLRPSKLNTQSILIKTSKTKSTFMIYVGTCCLARQHNHNIVLRICCGYNLCATWRILSDCRLHNILLCIFKEYIEPNQHQHSTDVEGMANNINSAMCRRTRFLVWCSVLLRSNRRCKQAECIYWCITVPIAFLFVTRNNHLSIHRGHPEPFASESMRNRMAFCTIAMLHKRKSSFVLSFA